MKNDTPSGNQFGRRRSANRSFDRVRNVVETSEREERYCVTRPVWETQEREERHLVRRQVWETAEREQCRTYVEPVTTCRTDYVDQGRWEAQCTTVPGPTRTRLTWMPPACVTDPYTGVSRKQRGGLVWAPRAAPSRTVVNHVWKPHIVARQTPVTQYVQRQVVEKIPVQVCRYVDEEVVRKVPVQVCRMVRQEMVRKVPVRVCRQVVERVEREVPVRTCRMVEEEHVRKVPITTCRMVTEERVEPYQVRICKMVPKIETVSVPHVVRKRVPVTYTRRVPRTVVLRVPIDPCTGEPLAVADSIPPAAAATPQASGAGDAAEGSVLRREAGKTETGDEPTPAKPEPVDEEQESPPPADLPAEEEPAVTPATAEEPAQDPAAAEAEPAAADAEPAAAEAEPAQDGQPQPRTPIESADPGADGADGEADKSADTAANGPRAHAPTFRPASHPKVKSSGGWRSVPRSK